MMPILLVKELKVRALLGHAVKQELETTSWLSHHVALMEEDTLHARAQQWHHRGRRKACLCAPSPSCPCRHYSSIVAREPFWKHAWSRHQRILIGVLLPVAGVPGAWLLGDESLHWPCSRTEEGCFEATKASPFAGLWAHGAAGSARS